MKNNKNRLFYNGAHTWLPIRQDDRVLVVHHLTAVRVRLIERRPEHERIQRTIRIYPTVQHTDFTRLTAAVVELGVFRVTRVSRQAGQHASLALFDAQLGRAANVPREKTRADQCGGQIVRRLEGRAVLGAVGDLLAGRAAVADHREDCVGERRITVSVASCFSASFKVTSIKPNNQRALAIEHAVSRSSLYTRSKLVHWVACAESGFKIIGQIHRAGRQLIVRTQFVQYPKANIYTLHISRTVSY